MKVTLAKEWTTKLRSHLPLYIDRGDSVNVWGLPTVGSSSHLRTIQNKISKDIECIYIDTQSISEISSTGFYTHLNTLLSQIANEETPKKLIRTPILLSQWYIEQLTTDKKLCVIIDKMEKLESLDEHFFSSIKSLRDKHLGSITFIFSSHRPLIEQEEFKKFKRFLDFACHKEIISDPYSDKDTMEIIKKLTKRYNIKISDKQKTEIVRFSGGIYGLIKILLRLYEDEDNEVSTEKHIENDQITTKLARIFESFNEKEQKYLTKQATGKKISRPNTKYLTKSGILQGNTVRSLLFDEFIKTRSNTKSPTTTRQSQKENAEIQKLIIDFSSGEIKKGEKRLPKLLSETEINIVKSMLNNEASITTREDIARIIWKEDAIEKYSDWAIDKTISRIRKKLGDTKHPYTHIITIKGKGFKVYLS